MEVRVRRMSVLLSWRGLIPLRDWIEMVLSLLDHPILHLESVDFRHVFAVLALARNTTLVGLENGWRYLGGRVLLHGISCLTIGLRSMQSVPVQSRGGDDISRDRARKRRWRGARGI